MLTSIERNISPSNYDDSVVGEHSTDHIPSNCWNSDCQSQPELCKRLYLVEANSGLRARIARMIFADGLHAEIFSSIGEFLEFSTMEIGVLVVNDNLDDEGGASIIERLTKARKNIPVIVYSEHATISKAIAIIRSGAENFIAINELNTKLRSAVEAISRVIEIRHTRQSKINEFDNRIRSLSRRENQVLEFLVSGLSNKEIAKELEISPRTVEIHRMKMLSKLAARTSVDAVRIWCSVSSGVYIRPIAQIRQ